MGADTSEIPRDKLVDCAYIFMVRKEEGEELLGGKTFQRDDYDLIFYLGKGKSGFVMLFRWF